MIARLPVAVTRRSLLAVLSGALGMAVPAAAAAKPVPARRLLKLLETYVAGTRYYEARRVRGGLRPGERLVLRREPENAFDDMAIEVFTGAGTKLGYARRADGGAVRGDAGAGADRARSRCHRSPGARRPEGALLPHVNGRGIMPHVERSVGPVAAAQKNAPLMTPCLLGHGAVDGRRGALCGGSAGGCRGGWEPS